MAIITTVAVLVAACVSFMLQQWSVGRQEARTEQSILASVIAASASADMTMPANPSLLAHDVAAARASRSLVDVRLIDAQGRTIAYFAQTQSRRGSPQYDDAGPIHLSVAPVVSGAERIGEVQVRSHDPTIISLLPRFLALTGALFFGASGIALFVAQSLSRRVTAPIERLSRAMAQIASSGEFVALDTEAADDDVFLRLISSFNELLTQLDANHKELCETLEDLMDARDAANAANVAKSQFLANMSHEIRTPLNGVLAMAEVMDRGDLSESQRERLTIVRQSGEQLLAVLNDVLDLSKIEAGKLELVEQDFELERVAQSARDGFDALAREKGVAFDLIVAPDAAGAWRGDSDRLRQIFANLVSNAIKFTAQGGVVARFEAADAGGLRLTVVDTGIGIPQDKIPHLFEKFTQADSSTTRQYGGTGLGLAICRELAQLMGGQISVRSELDKGSTFVVELPFQRAAAADAEASDDAGVDVSQRSVRVLAAEDNIVNQKVLKAIVEPMGVDLSIVGDGRAAIEAWRDGAFDVILMDIQMPVMDGIAAARAIRTAEAAAGLPRTPILALTANALVHQVEEYLAAGMDGHIAKPIEIAKLYDALGRALSQPAETAGVEGVRPARNAA
ncbi:MAG TPA: ATP-binding protein [Caulobacteraceae bacterium]|nr:ATP-binding protein [Caulobacteraceae bacterium]